MTIRDIVKQEVKDYIGGIIAWLFAIAAIGTVIFLIFWAIYQAGYSQGHSESIRTCAPMIVGLRG